MQSMPFYPRPQKGSLHIYPLLQLWITFLGIVFCLSNRTSYAIHALLPPAPKGEFTQLPFVTALDHIFERSILS